MSIKTLKMKEYENKDFYNMITSSGYTRISELNQNQKFDQAIFTIYGNSKCIIERICEYKNNAENSASTKISKHIPSDFVMSTISLFVSLR